MDAITASTITSRAFLEAVRRAYETYKNDSNSPGVDSITSQNKPTEGGTAL
ncbi:MAG: FMN-binding protein [Mangrovibacterium sp.]